MKIPIILVGLGWVGTHRHARALLKNTDFNIVGVIDRHDGRAKEFASRHDIAWYSDKESLTEISDLPNSTAIAIATPPETHFKLVSEALSLNRHVLVEKPFAMSVAEGANMIALAEQKDLRLCITHNFLFSRSASLLKTDFKKGSFGAIKRIHALQLSNPKRRLPTWCETLPLGLFYDESPHLLYLINHFMGDGLTLEQSLLAQSTVKLNTPNMIQATYRGEFEGQSIPVTLNMSFEAPVSEWHFSIIGEHAMAVIDLFRDIYIRIPNDGRHGTFEVFRTSISATYQHWSQHFISGYRHLSGRLDYGNRQIYRRFHKAIMSGKPDGDIGGQSALSVLKMQHDIIAKSRVFA